MFDGKKYLYFFYFWVEFMFRFYVDLECCIVGYIMVYGGYVDGYVCFWWQNDVWVKFVLLCGSCLGCGKLWYLFIEGCMMMLYLQEFYKFNLCNIWLNLKVVGGL